MKEIIKRFLPQWVINYFWHLPKAIMANVVYGFPTRNLKVIGVTGTDGKTTTVNMTYQILKESGKKVSMISTINAEVAGKIYDTGFHVTSPDPFLVQKFAKDAADHGDEYLILEVTSHALDQYRFWGIKFEVGVVTNITHEHLDYHKTFEKYKNTKLKLLHNADFIVMNEQIKDVGKVKGKVVTFGLGSGDFNQKEVRLNLKVPGEFNVENALASLAVAFILSIQKETARRVLENFAQPAGRMEEVKNNRGIKIVIDFAHTPNALEQALKTLRSQAGRGKIIAVFGCAGKRDEGKRPLLGEVAGKLADYVVVTAEDPRGELEKISRQIVTGAKKAGLTLDRNLFVIGDRQKAIEVALDQLAKKGDTVGIFGKGHEISMNLDGKKEIPWSDRGTVEKTLNG